MTTSQEFRDLQSYASLLNVKAVELVLESPNLVDIINNLEKSGYKTRGFHQIMGHGTEGYMDVIADPRKSKSARRILDTYSLAIISQENEEGVMYGLIQGIDSKKC